MKFLGNKNRVSSFLLDEFSKLKIVAGANVLDLFSGTGSVSKLLSNVGYNVTSVDALKLSYYLTYSKLHNAPIVDNSFLFSFIQKKKDGYITNNYSEKVKVNIFTQDIAVHIDACLEILKRYKNKSSTEFHFLMATLLEESDFRSNIMGSYESFYKRGWRKQALKEWTFNIVKNRTQTINTVINSSVEDFFEVNDKIYDMVYADPPYNNRQYGSVFHTLETIATFYNGEVRGKINRPINEFSSDFCKLSAINKAFDNLFSRCSKITNTFCLSYNDEGLLSKESIYDIGRKYFTKVGCKKLLYRRFNTNKKNNKKKVYEFLFKFQK